MIRAELMMGENESVILHHATVSSYEILRSIINDIAHIETFSRFLIHP